MPTFASSDQAREWGDQWVQQHLPSRVVAEMIEQQRDHVTRFMREYGRWCTQFEVEYSALVQLLHQVNFIDKSSWQPHRSLQYMLFSYNAETFFSAFDRLLRGHYEDSITLTRSLYETFVRGLFMSCYPATATSALLSASDVPKGVRKFNLTNFLRDDLHLKWGRQYGLMSRFAHSNSFGVLQAVERATKGESEPERFGVVVRFDPVLAEAAPVFLQFVLLSHLRFSVERLASTASVPNTDVLTMAREAVSFLDYGLRHHPKPYWRAVAEDLDVVFEMLDIADRGGDWQAFVEGEGRDRQGD